MIAVAACIAIVIGSGLLFMRWDNVISDPGGATTDPVDYTKINIRGNTPANIMNQALAAYNDGWIYYNKTGVWSENAGLYKIREDGAGEVKISDLDARYINAVGDYVYFTVYNTDAEGIPPGCSLYKIRADGTGETLLYEETAAFFENVTVVGDWVYYNRYAVTGYDDREYDRSTSVYRIMTDGTEHTRLNEIDSEGINIVNDRIYYMSGGNIYKMRLDGGENTLIDENSGYVSRLLVDGDWVYFSHGSQHEDGIKYSKIYKMKTDGTGKNIIYEDENSMLYPNNVSEDWLYFTQSVPDVWGGDLCRINKEGAKQTVLSDCSQTFIIGDWIYYRADNKTEYRQRESLRKMRLDGTEQSEINSAGTTGGD
ncbi:MAG: DUF5050 domain-containing protein [Oscillospiraceae bacterium]|nr:DUF5050 domain-containing protein [Oscillospiraceae bacterium]